MIAKETVEEDDLLCRYPLIQSHKKTRLMKNNGFITLGSSRPTEIESTAKLMPVSKYPVYNSETINYDKSNGKEGKSELHFPSYTAMIAQAVLSTEEKKIALGGIYEFIENRYQGLEKRVKGWQNCVRHNLSLNECFIKVGRSDNGRGSDWTIHPNYFSSFLRGEYRKRRVCAKQRYKSLFTNDAFQYNDRIYNRCVQCMVSHDTCCGRDDLSVSSTGSSCNCF